MGETMKYYGEQQKADSSTLNGAVDLLKGLSQDMSGVKADVGVLKQDTSQIRVDVNDLNKRVTTLEQRDTTVNVVMPTPAPAANNQAPQVLCLNIDMQTVPCPTPIP